jgi:predicted RND superfamily exporter protein
VEDLLEEWPRNAADLARLRERVFANPLYLNLLISEDAQLATVMLELETYSSLGSDVDALAGFEQAETPDGGAGERPFMTGEEIVANVTAARGVVERHDAPGFRLHMTGGPAVEVTLMTAMQEDIVRFVSLSVLMIALFLFILFRRAAGVALPLAVVVLSLVCTLGTMAASGVAITLPVQVLPSFLLAVGVCASIHILAIYFRALEEGSSRERAIKYSLGHSGLAVVMTSLTTAGGLVAFASADLTPVMHFGIFGPLGVGFALLFTLVLLPALLVVTPLRKRPARGRPAREPWLDRALLGCGVTSTRHPRSVLAVTAGLLALGLAGALRLEFSHNTLIWLPETEPVRVATELVDRKLQGSMTLEALLETGVENGFHNPRLLAKLDELRAYAETLNGGAFSNGKTVSVADVLKEINRALNENRPEHYSIPRDPLLVAQEFLLFENAGCDDLEDVVDSQFSLAGFNLRIPYTDAVETTPFIDEIEAHFREVLGEDARVTMTGSGVLHTRTFYAVIRSMTKSYAIALVVVTPFMIVLLGSLRGGLISMIPNLTPIILTLGLMGWLGFPLDFSTMMVGAIVLGLAVDDTIHFMHGFQRYYRQSADPEAAVQSTLHTTGRAMLFTSIVLAAGWFIYMLATMGNLFNLGVFTGFAIIVAFLADVLLAPALMIVACPPLPNQGALPGAGEGTPPGYSAMLERRAVRNDA